ncbi:MAG: 30S ribosomal protein S8 [Candidatus Omnitrophica bacterium CG11_big_fil_rev_8_21_14_0_20_42_13]|uniref:Small ribosomal subunit protein uS8 n=1 Tax=Candidatus Ghiorseimicrobium undicola TaxID=1974746 RepID=A0A2H0LVI0_9BACT|nr:MAG: 30S ribosomal protein S8 [Candidatus Omnitrophica bacterium CG11_big_fil_rev_8_21_14_0_20_42_13]
MSSNDLIANVLTMIRNAIRAHKEKVDVPASGIVRSLLDILKREGYIEDFKLLEELNSRMARVYLKFDENDEPAIKGLKRISKQSLRVYSSRRQLPRVLRGQGIAVISTSKGVLTDKEAREARVGGEVVCYVW